MPRKEPAVIVTRLLPLVVVAGCVSAQAPEWPADLGQARQQAAAEHKPLVVLVRTDWDVDSEVLYRRLRSAETAEALAGVVTCQMWAGHKPAADWVDEVPSLLVLDHTGAPVAMRAGLGQTASLRAWLADRCRDAARAAELRAKVKQGGASAEELAALVALLAESPDPAEIVKLYHSLENLRKLSPAEQAQAELARGQELAAQRKWGEALKAVTALNREALAAADRVRVARLRATCLRRSGKPAEAAQALEQVVTEAPADEAPELWWLIARLYHAAGNHERALAARQITANKYPDSEAAGKVILETVEDLWLRRGEAAEAERLLGQLAEVTRSPSVRTGAAGRLAFLRAERALNRRQERRVAADVVVLVPDVATLLQYLSLWDENTWFPILLNEPWFAKLFIEAYHPARVIVAPKRADVKLSDETVNRALLASLDGRALDEVPTASLEQLAAAMHNAAGRSPGVVVTETGAEELAGGIALAAGRRQPLLRVQVKPTHSDVISQEELDRLAGQISKQLQASKLKYDDLGDDVDFITIAADLPYRFEARSGVERRQRAVDDALGRRADGLRWAFVGRLIGGPAQTCYQAMCSLFLRPKNALFFNTYSTKPGTEWAAYSPTRAEPIGLVPDHLTVEGGDASLTSWYGRFRPRSTYDLAFLNTAGGRANWNIRGGGGVTDDLPLTVPVAIEFTHSGSAADPWDPHSIAGRWLLFGCYAYFGSYAEPYLSAFVRPSDYVRRLERGWPWGMAFRRLPAQPYWTPWRLWCLGDPLYVVRQAQQVRAASAPPLPGTPLAEVAQAGGTLQRAKALWLLGKAPEAQAAWQQIDGSAVAADQKEQYRLLKAALLAHRDAWDKLQQYVAGLPEAERTPHLVALQRFALFELLRAAQDRQDFAAALAQMRALAQTKPYSVTFTKVLPRLERMNPRGEQKEQFRAFVSELRQTQLTKGSSRKMADDLLKRLEGKK